MKTKQNVITNFIGIWKSQIMTRTFIRQGCRTLDNRGFTLVELFMVVAIIGILATLAIPAYSNIKDKARTSRAISEIRLIEKAVLAFSIDKNRLPHNKAELGPEIDNIQDPWKHAYVYYEIPSDLTDAYKDFMGNEMNKDFDLYSKGSDNTSLHDLSTDPNGLDDIVRGGDGSTVELGKEY